MFLYYIFKKLFFFYFLLPLIISFFISFVFTNFFINYLNRKKVFQNIRPLGPKGHEYKSNIPTMGGFIILFPFLFFLIFYFFFNFHNIIFFLFLYFFLNFLIGFFDDYLKCFRFNSNGLSIFIKFILQTLVSLLYVIYLYNFFFKESNYILDILNFKFKFNYIYILFYYLFLFCILNAVNFTDGLDGLVSIPLILNFLFLVIIIFYYYYNFIFFNFYYVSNFLLFLKNLLIIISIIIGFLFSFLYYNFYPAKIFLGDVGSLSLGCLLASLFIILNKELYLFVSGFVFIIEFLSVFLQILFFKLFKKKIFNIAPIHHHLESLGYKEINIVIFFWFLSFLFFIFSLLILFYNNYVNL